MDTNNKWQRVFGKEVFEEKGQFTGALDCFSVFEESKGIIVVISRNEVLSIKVTVTSNPKAPLQCGDIARIKKIKGNKQCEPCGQY